MGRRTRATAWAGVAALAVAPSAACGGGDPAPRATVTVTVKPSPDKLKGAKPNDERSIAGRVHDVGTIVRASGSGASQVLVLDRWSVRGVDDEELAKKGVRVVPEMGDRFFNENVEKLYDVPVGDDVLVIFNRCEPSADPGGPAGMLSIPGTLGEFLALGDRTNVVTILTYAGGRLVKLETNPRCPKPAATPGATGTPPAGRTPGPGGSPGPSR